ncbi:MAG: hypothetical protein AAFO74_01770 [Pseudomonadota bacterium]
MPRHSLICAAALLWLGACTSSIQTTSGADYLARYDASHEAANGVQSDVDADIREIAAIEPNLLFPARIGLARFQHGKLTTLPEDEARIWQDAIQSAGGEFGEIVPVSPLIAALVEEAPARGSNPAVAAIGNIRRGAARQHLDYVLAYEVGSHRTKKANAYAIADLTIIGMFVLPSRTIQVDAVASGLMLDVRTGYPYATLITYAEKSGLSRAVSQTSTGGAYKHSAEARAVDELAGEFVHALSALKGHAEASETTH